MSVDSASIRFENTSICFENAQNIPGYVTEKIFDPMFAGCIPVYWGAPNIIKHVPAECFIDFSQFNDYQELYKYLKALDFTQVKKYQTAIYEYLNSDQVKPYSAEYFAETVSTEITKYLSPRP